MWHAPAAPSVQCCLALSSPMPALDSIGACVASASPEPYDSRQGPCLPLPRCAVRPAWSRVSPGPHSEAQQSCLRVASPSHGSMAVAWTRAVMGSGRVRVSMGACMSKAAWKAPRLCARMGPGSHDQAWAVLGSLSSSVKALYYMGLEPAVICRQMSQSQRRSH